MSWTQLDSNFNISKISNFACKVSGTTRSCLSQHYSLLHGYALTSRVCTSHELRARTRLKPLKYPSLIQLKYKYNVGHTLKFGKYSG